MAVKKIASDTIIKEVVGKSDGKYVKFGRFIFTPGQTEKLMDIAESKEKVRVTIEVIQPNLIET